jgi:hypothetical protein
MSSDYVAFMSDFNASLMHPNGKAYFFKNDLYQRFDFEMNRFEKVGKIGRSGWKGVWTTGINAALLHPNGKGYFFKGVRYQRYDFAKDEVDKEATINVDGWKGVWTEGIDAALMHPNGRAYFFRGGRYRRFDFDSNEVDKEGRTNVNGWKGVWRGGIDTAILHPNGHAYFFSGNKYQRYDFKADEVDKEARTGIDGWLLSERYISNRLIVREFDQIVQQYISQFVKDNIKSVGGFPPQIKLNKEAKAFLEQVAAKRDEIADAVLKEEIGNDESESDDEDSDVEKCMERKSKERKEEHPDEEADPENYRWACYSEIWLQEAIKRFGRWFDDKVVQPGLKWLADSEKKVRKWIADRKIERDAKNTWENLMERGRIGGEIGRFSEAVKDILNKINPFP